MDWNMETLKSGRAKEYRIESIRFDFLLETMPIRRHSQGAETKKTVSQEFYVKQNYPSKIKVK